jgi:hypothetical protein
MLLNIDKPLRTSTLHEATCAYIPKPHGTPLKPLENLGRDGGWFSASSESAARAIVDRECPGSEFKLCNYCWGRS